MSEKYDEIMDRIKADAQMRGRVLANINRELSGAGKKQAGSSRFMRYIPEAACAAVLLIACAVAVPRLIKNDIPQQQMTVEGIYSVEELKDLDSLEAAVGFDVRELEELPFEVERKSYISFFAELAQIDYEGADNSCTYRVSAGSEDNSGNYNEYSNTQELIAAGITVTLKGGDDGCSLALWESAGYSYSVQFANPVSGDEIEDMLKAWAD